MCIPRITSESVFTHYPQITLYVRLSMFLSLYGRYYVVPSCLSPFLSWNAADPLMQRLLSLHPSSFSPNRLLSLFRCRWVTKWCVKTGVGACSSLLRVDSAANAGPSLHASEYERMKRERDSLPWGPCKIHCKPVSFAFCLSDRLLFVPFPLTPRTC